MKRKTIIGTAIIAAFLMLSTMVFVNPVPATIPKDNPKGLDPELIELVDTYVNGLSTFTNELQANSQTNTLLNDIENNREVMELVNQIKNTEDPEEKQELMKNLIETLKTNNKVEELAKLTQTDSFVKDTIDIEEYMQNMVNYMQENTETTDSALDPKQLSLAETDTYQIQMNFMVIPAIMMVELGEEPEECPLCPLNNPICDHLYSAAFVTSLASEWYFIKGNNFRNAGKYDLAEKCFEKGRLYSAISNLYWQAYENLGC